MTRVGYTVVELTCTLDIDLEDEELIDELPDHFNQYMDDRGVWLQEKAGVLEFAAYDETHAERIVDHVNEWLDLARSYVEVVICLDQKQIDLLYGTGTRYVHELENSLEDTGAIIPYIDTVRDELIFKCLPSDELKLRQEFHDALDRIRTMDFEKRAEKANLSNL